jgi:predicted ATPase
MPWFLGPIDRSVLQRELVGATQERMLREMAETCEVLMADTLLVLVLEDLYWSDYATLDLLALLARRREPARLMVLGTYRPADVMISGHPLPGVQQELHIHGQCEEVSFTLLSLSEVARYLAIRFPQHGFPDELAQMIYWRTDGHPLFMLNVVESLVAQGLLKQGGERWRLRGCLDDVAVELPESLRHIIEQQIERLGPEAQQVLEAASVVALRLGGTGHAVRQCAPNWQTRSATLWSYANRSSPICRSRPERKPQCQWGYHFFIHYPLTNLSSQ